MRTCRLFTRAISCFRFLQISTWLLCSHGSVRLWKGLSARVPSNYTVSSYPQICSSTTSNKFQTSTESSTTPSSTVSVCVPQPLHGYLSHTWSDHWCSGSHLEKTRPNLKERMTGDVSIASSITMDLSPSQWYLSVPEHFGIYEFQTRTTRVRSCERGSELES